MKRHIAVYIRVSSGQQDTRSQLPDLDAWLAAYAAGEEVVRYVDKLSGRSMDRPAWNRLHDAMVAGYVSKIVTWRLDRLGRNISGLATLFEELQVRRVGFESIKDKIDLSTAAGRLLAHVLASVAVYENELRSERIRAGQNAARTQGIRWGGSKKGRRLTINDDQIATVKKLAKAGESKVAIARATGVSRQSVYRILNESA